MDVVALASVISSGTVGGGGLAFVAFNAAKERGHRTREAAAQREYERGTAKTERLFERRSLIYVEMLTWVKSEMLAINRINPILGPAPEPPEPMPEAEYLSLEARVSAFGSQSVLDALEEFREHERQFMAASGIFDRSGDLVKEIHEARTKAREAVKELEKRVRQELASL